MADNTIKTPWIITAPANWQGIIKNYNKSQYPLDSLITINTYPPPSVNILATNSYQMYDFKDVSKMDGSLTVIKPDDDVVTEDIRHEYGSELGRIGNFITGFKKTIAGLMRDITAIGGNYSKEGIFFEEPVYFTNTEKRAFSFDLVLFAYSDVDNDVYQPIRWLKYFSHAKKINNTTLRLQFPNVFTIKGREFNYMNLGYCVLTGIGVQYGDKSKMTDKLGRPMQATVSLNFEELRMRFAQDFINNSNPDINIITK